MEQRVPMTPIRNVVVYPLLVLARKLPDDRDVIGSVKHGIRA